MTDEVLNQLMLPGNVCFGCGHDNPHGLHVQLRRDPEDSHRLLGTFEPPEYLSGFPGVTHRGAVYTALDCLAVWTPTTLRRETRAVWVLRSTGVNFLHPALQGAPVYLSSTIEEEGSEWSAVVVRTEARDGEGTLLAEGTFKVIPLPPERFLEMAGIDRFPENWERFLAREDD